jgi:rod shape-determining protein MreD
MIKKIIFLIFLFYFLVLIQTSFLIHFSFRGIVPNFVLIAVIFINFFEKPEKRLGLISALLGGFYLDIFSLSFPVFFGFSTLTFLAISFFIKFILRRYVSLPSIKKI